MPLNASGFTLVEILVSVAIIAMISILAIPNFKAFNESQSLNNATQDLVSTLRSAQANAQLGALCPSGRASSSWSVYFANSTSGYQLQASCVNPSPPPATTTEIRSTTQLPQSISLSSPDCGAFPINISFTLNNPSIACSIVVTDHNIGSNNAQTIVINQGGAINVQ